MSRTKKVFAVLAVFVLAAAALVVGRGLSLINSLGGGHGVISGIDSIRNPRGQFPAKDRLNVLLIGKDYNRDSKGMPYTKGARSDTLIVLSLDMAGRKISALSIPRDTYVTFPDTGRHGKINAAYARGGETLAMQTVSNLLGVPIDYYIALKPDAVKTVVDSLGGVEVEAIDRMKYDDNWGQLHIDLPPGRQVVNGTQAIGFTRFRKANEGEPRSKEEGDERRMARQQQLLRAMIQKAKQPQMLLQAEGLVDTAYGAIDTNLQRLQLLALGALFRDVAPEQIQGMSVIGEDFLARQSYFRPDPEKLGAQVDWLLRGDESAANRLTVVEVQNGTAIRGAAREVADLLRGQGFDAKSAGNTRREAELVQTRIVYGKAAVEARARRIAELLGGGTLAKEPKTTPEGADVTVVLGRDVAPQFAAREARL
jgi:LCP family protein required for cell wall assembly